MDGLCYKIFCDPSVGIIFICNCSYCLKGTTQGKFILLYQLALCSWGEEKTVADVILCCLVYFKEPL